MLIVRHAASTWNDEQRWQGSADPPLSAAGEAQAAQAGERLASSDCRFDVLTASDLVRAVRTAEVVAAEIGLTGGIETRAGLREYDVGAWSGLTRDDIEARWPGQIARWRAGDLAATPGGEQRAGFDARVARALTEIGEAHPGRRVLAVSHGGVIAAVGRIAGRALGHVHHLAGCEITLGGSPARVAVSGTVNLLGGPEPVLAAAEGHGAPGGEVPSEA